MRSCEHVERDSFAEALYGDLDETRQAAFESHLKNCAACAELYAELRRTLDIMGERIVDEPPPGYWDDFGNRIRERIANGEPNRGRVLDRRPWPVPHARHERRGLPRWAYQIAAAAAILVFGITIGRLSLGPASEPPTPPAGVDGLDQRVSQYMDRSRTLLLGIVNLDPAADGAEVVDLAPYRRLSQQLVAEAPGLKRDLSGTGQRRLARLVLELEEILLQIARLEGGRAIDGVQVVQEGVEQRALLFKIHLESTRQPKETNPRNAPSAAPGQI